MPSLKAALLSMAMLLGSVVASPMLVARNATNGINPNSASASLDAAYIAFIETWRTSLIVENTTTSQFYATPSNFSTAAPGGQTLKIQLINNSTLGRKYNLPGGFTLWRIMYTSKDLNYDTVPASGFISAPWQTTGQTAVWTHGTSGVTRDCAPSNSPTLQYGWSGPFLLASQGYTVLAPDYAGQGTDTTFNYLAGRPHAEDASFIYEAAKKSLPKLKIDKWAVMGHSEGGISAWATNERQKKNPSGGFLGAIALAPAMNPQEIMYRTFNVPADRLRTEIDRSVFYTEYHFETCRRYSPSLDPNKYLTAYGLQLRKLNLGGGCYPGAFSLLAQNVSLDDIWKDESWVNSTECTAWGNGIGSKGEDQLAAPMLVIQGSEDDALFPKLVYDTFDRHCSKFGQKSPVQLSIYGGQTHTPVIAASVQEWSKFLADLFDSGKPSDFKQCRSQVIPNNVI